MRSMLQSNMRPGTSAQQVRELEHTSHMQALRAAQEENPALAAAMMQAAQAEIPALRGGDYTQQVSLHGQSMQNQHVTAQIAPTPTAASVLLGASVPRVLPAKALPETTVPVLAGLDVSSLTDVSSSSGWPEGTNQPPSALEDAPEGVKVAHKKVERQYAKQLDQIVGDGQNLAVDLATADIHWESTLKLLKSMTDADEISGPSRNLVGCADSNEEQQAVELDASGMHTTVSAVPAPG